MFFQFVRSVKNETTKIALQMQGILVLLEIFLKNPFTTDGDLEVTPQKTLNEFFSSALSRSTLPKKRKMFSDFIDWFCCLKTY